MSDLVRFDDRQHAGRVLADAIIGSGVLPPEADVLVLGVARGGLPVAAEVASHLGAPLDVVVGRKIGAPRNPEFAVGALAMDGAPILHADVIHRLRIDDAYIESEISRQRAEIERRLAVYRGQRPAIAVAGRTVIVVDDGVATGATLKAVLSWVKQAGADSTVCAVPVGPEESLAALADVADVVVCPLRPRYFRAVGEWYVDFSQTTDAEVRALLGT